MKIDAIDFFYLSMPEVTDEADGSQDALVVRVARRRPCRLGRMRGIAAALDRRLRHADVAWRLPPVAQRRCSASGSTSRPTSRGLPAAIAL